MPPLRVALYLVLFALAIAIVFRGIPYWIGLIIIPLVLIFADRSALKKVDYPLLLTFVFFFIFAGNMARIDVVRNFFSMLLNQNTLLVSVVSCQFISNVPTAIFLSKFTENYRDLLVSVNIGSLGIIISSLASLITLKEFLKHQPKNFKRYMLMFTGINTARTVESEDFDGVALQGAGKAGEYIPEDNKKAVVKVNIGA